MSTLVDRGEPAHTLKTIYGTIGRVPAAERRLGLIVAVSAIIITVGIASVRLAINPRFYFADDTQLGSIGIWHEMARLAAKGAFPILNPHAWQAGNYFAEGQWGLFNPLSWLIGIGSAVTADVLFYVTAIKLSALGALALGVYLLAREYGGSVWWSGAGAVMVPAAGFTSYMDAPSWVSGLLNAAAFSYTWWGLRRIQKGRNPLAFLVSAYLLITFGYVFGVIMLVGLLCIVLIGALVQRSWRTALNVAIASVFGGLVTVATYLPGILTAGVTERGTSNIIQAWFLNADLTDFGGIAAPTASMSIAAWWGPITHAPIMYLSWALPLAITVWPALRRSCTELLTPLALAAVVVILILGPSHVGPLRWPVRFLPYLAMAMAVVWAVSLTRGYPALVTRRRITAALIVTVALNWLAWTQTPTAKLLVLTTSAVLLGIAVIGLLAVSKRLKWSATARSAVAAGLVAAGTVAALVPQLYEYRYTPLGTFAVPTSASSMQSVLAGRQDDGFVVGDVYAGAFEPESFDELLVGNLWYYSPTSVSNLYTVLPFTTFSSDLCIDLRGATCAEAMKTLMSADKTTGLTVGELLGVNTVIAVKESFTSRPETPDGWRLVQDGSTVWTYERIQPVATAGGLTYVGEGTRVTVLNQTDTHLTVRVDDVGPDGRLVFSRLAYPGYSVEGGQLTAPVRGYLLTVDVSDASPGDIVTVTFRPPGWTLEITSLAAALLIAVTWPVMVAVRARRGRVAAEPHNTIG